jgi:SAM-dependent methyltransferase
MGWQHGYFADEGYSYGFYPQQSPVHIAFAALLQGHRPPDLSGPFHYLDLGCGQGVATCLLAAAYPQARFTGVDFHPQHIAHARRLAGDCGLENVHFAEADFLELARQLPADWPPVDFAVAHGIASWIAPPVREALLQLVSRALRPGGLFYVSYNTHPGWLAMVPFQHLVATMQRHHQPGQPSLNAARELFGQLRQAEAAVMKVYPGLPKQLGQLENQDPAYLVQEYNNGSWQPMFVNQMMGEAAAAKLSYLGSATLVENFEPFYAPAHRQILAQAGSPELRELYRDLLINQTFRRDLYVKGTDRYWGEEALGPIENLQVEALVDAEWLEQEHPFSLACSLGKIRADPGLMRPLMEVIQAAPRRLGELRRELAGIQQGPQAPALMPLPLLLRSLALLLEKRAVAVVSPAGDAAAAGAQRTNRYLVRCITAGAPYGALAAPRVGSAISIGRGEAVALGGLLRGVPQDELAAYTQRLLTRQGRLPRDANGQPITDAAAAAAALQSATVTPLLNGGLARLQRLGAWPG